MQKSKTSLEKNNLHPRNKHRSGYDFKELSQRCPELSSFVSVNKYGNESIDFSDPKAVKILNKALLNYFYGIQYWDIPEHYLCPPIPGRADYIHYMADLLSSSNNGILPNGKSIQVLDIGIGANCVYPIIGNHEYGWNFKGAEIDPFAIKAAKAIVASNSSLEKTVEFRLQNSSRNIFKDMITPTDFFDMTICNPPFHSSLAEAKAGTDRKWKNLGIKKAGKPALNFGGQNLELWCEGGEALFVRRMIAQSALYPTNCFWYSTLISKSSNLPGVYNALSNAKALDVKTISMAQGQKISRIVAWTFLNEVQQKEWRLNRWKI